MDSFLKNTKKEWANHSPKDMMKNAPDYLEDTHEDHKEKLVKKTGLDIDQASKLVGKV